MSSASTGFTRCENMTLTLGLELVNGVEWRVEGGTGFSQSKKFVPGAQLRQPEIICIAWQD